jgi:tetratricopeptide (TPR) repeat protein
LRHRLFLPALSAAAILAVLSLALPAHATSSADELVRQAQAHEAAQENDVALRRYTEALSIEVTNENAWMGLGALRLKMGDAVEAERVYSSALSHVPAMHRALQGRARARWTMGHHAEAEDDLETFAALEGDASALKELAGWYGADGRSPAQLATWRRLLAAAARADDATAVHEARTMVRALVILVGGADPAAAPVRPDATRRAMAVIAKRGGS